MTHPDANEGTAVGALCRMLDVPAGAVAIIGDGRNDTGTPSWTALREEDR